jgi:hypothetical protein
MLVDEDEERKYFVKIVVFFILLSVAPFSSSPPLHLLIATSWTLLALSHHPKIEPYSYPTPSK